MICWCEIDCVEGGGNSEILVFGSQFTLGEIELGVENSLGIATHSLSGPSSIMAIHSISYYFGFCQALNFDSYFQLASQARMQR
jgi:hypothetical protein